LHFTVAGFVVEDQGHQAGTGPFPIPLAPFEFLGGPLSVKSNERSNDATLEAADCPA
jgi:hypothetical protein